MKVKVNVSVVVCDLCCVLQVVLLCSKAVIFSEGKLYGYWGYDLELTLIRNYS